MVPVFASPRMSNAAMFDAWLDTVSVELVGVVCLLATIYFAKAVAGNWKSNALHSPPGPMGLPIVGYLPFITSTPHLKIQKLAKKYGDVMRLRLGSQTIVVLSSGKILREAFENFALNDRPVEEITDTMALKKPAAFLNNGKIWVEHRKFALRTFRMLGLGKSKVHELLQGEIQRFLKVVGEKPGEQLFLKDPLYLSVTNCISALLYSQTYESNEHVDIALFDQVLEATNKPTLRAMFTVFPWIKKIPFVDKLLSNKPTRDKVEMLTDIMREKIEDHKKTFDEADLRDFIDAYNGEMKNHHLKNTSTTMSESELPVSIVLFYGAGIDTILTTLLWCFYTMAAFPEVQTKVQNEIDNVVGKERLPYISDKLRLPYTQSVLMEVQRWQTVVPINFPRVAPRGAVIGGYSIPKGSMVVGNIWAIHHDVRQWNKPDEFIAERFLSDDGCSVMKNENYLPFGHGKRSCLGEVYAVTVVFLYFTSMMQKYVIRLPEGVIPDFSGVTGITYGTKPFDICLTPRD